jgi:cob(I)alamin adenosyltransferase
MVKLDRIYTRGGDGGETSLADGTRVSKDTPRIAAQGDIDEANAALGLARLHVKGGDLDPYLGRVQNDMFDLGADISMPGSEPAADRLRITDAHVLRLEREIDALKPTLPPLRSFVLRGGTPAAAHLHFACTVVRRAERALVALGAAEAINPRIVAYLNRVSDLLFVLARKANDDGRVDVLWQPGKNAKL